MKMAVQDASPDAASAAELQNLQDKLAVGGKCHWHFPDIRGMCKKAHLCSTAASLAPHAVNLLDWVMTVHRPSLLLVWDMFGMVTQTGGSMGCDDTCTGVEGLISLAGNGNSIVLQHKHRLRLPVQKAHGEPGINHVASSYFKHAQEVMWIACKTPTQKA